MRPRTFVGIDPGGRRSGVVTRRGNHLAYAAVVTREFDIVDYIEEVLLTIRRAARTAPSGEDWLVAIETVRPPVGHLGMINMRGLLDTAAVFGAVVAIYNGAVLVPPGGHGSAPLSCYPPGLVGAGEVVGAGRRRHTRSAWDIAAVADRIEPHDTKAQGGT